MHLRILRSESDPVGLHLVLFMHHALYDGLSIPSLLSHVEHIYQNQEIARPAQFFDFIPRMLSQQDQATAYWTKRLQNHHPVSLLRNTVLSSKGIIATRLVPVQKELFVQFVHDNAVTLQCLAQAVWAKYLASSYASNDVVFGHVVSGRSFDDSEKVVGPMLVSEYLYIICEDTLFGFNSEYNSLSRPVLSAYEQSRTTSVNSSFQC
jgi:hypothetical protein